MADNEALDRAALVSIILGADTCIPDSPNPQEQAEAIADAIRQERRRYGTDKNDQA